MRTAAVLVVIVAMATAGAAQSPTAQTAKNFEGKWTLATTGASPDTANMLLVIVPDAAPLVGVERGYADGVRNENYSLDPARRGFYPARWMGGSLVLTRLAPPAGRARAASASDDHREVWTILPGDVLNIDVTETRPATAPVTTHLTYKRVPLADAIVPGQNLLDNPDATAQRAGWFVQGDAKVEACGDNPCFVLRNHASFEQTVLLPPSASGKYVVLIGSGATERINPDGAITGQPYLHGIAAIAGTGKTLTHLNGQQMAGRLRTADEWTTLSGVFAVPAGAIRLSLQLNQSEARGTPQNGSATRFDHVGVFLFPSESDARAFIANWRGR